MEREEIKEMELLFVDAEKPDLDRGPMDHFIYRL
jgi:hypothetical protein